MGGKVRWVDRSGGWIDETKKLLKENRGWRRVKDAAVAVAVSGGGRHGDIIRITPTTSLVCGAHTTKNLDIQYSGVV